MYKLIYNFFFWNTNYKKIWIFNLLFFVCYIDQFENFSWGKTFESKWKISSDCMKPRFYVRTFSSNSRVKSIVDVWYPFFLKINLHLAHVSKNRNLYINRYLLGKRVARDVFNLNSIFYSFYLIIPFIQALIRKKKKMLFFSLEPKIAFFFKHLINKILQYYIEIPWIFGSITNSSWVKWYLMIKEKKNLYSSFDTIVLFNCNYTLPVMKEIFSLNKPIIGICNSTNKFLKYFDYILPGNTQSINSVYFYITFFYHIILKELLILYLD